MVAIITVVQYGSTIYRDHEGLGFQESNFITQNPTKISLLVEF